MPQENSCHEKRWMKTKLDLEIIISEKVYLLNIFRKLDPVSWFNSRQFTSGKYISLLNFVFEILKDILLSHTIKSA